MNHQAVRALALLLVTGLPSAAIAGPAPRNQAASRVLTLSLGEGIRLALRGSQAIREAEADLDIAGARVVRASRATAT